MEAPIQHARLRAIAAGIALFVALAIHILVPVLAWSWSRSVFVGTLPRQTPVLSGIEFSPATFRSADWVIHLAIPYLVGLCYLGASVWNLGRFGAGNRTLTLALFCAGASILISSRFETLTTRILTRLWSAAGPLTGVSIIYLALAVAPEAGAWSTLKRWQPLLLLPALALVVWIQVVLDGPDTRASLPAWLAGLGFLAASILGCIGILLAIHLRSLQAPLRQQAQLLLLAAIVACTPLAIWATVSISRQLQSAAWPHRAYQPELLLPPLALFPLVASYVNSRQLADKNLLPGARRRDRQSYWHTLRTLGRELAGSQDPDQILAKLAACVNATLGPRHLLVFMASPTGGYYEQHTVLGDVDATAIRGYRLDAQDKIISRMARSGESMTLAPKTIKALRLEDQARARWEDLEVVLLVPMRSKEYLLGILMLGRKRPGRLYTRDDVSFLTMMADQAAVAIENALLSARQAEQERRLIQKTGQLTKILALADKLKSLDRDLVMQSTVEAVHEGLGFQLVTLSLLSDDDPTSLRIAAWAGVENSTWERLISKSFPLVDPESAAGVQKMGRCYLMHAPGLEAGESPLPGPTPWHEGDQLLVPLSTDEGLLGYLVVDRPADHLLPTEETLEVLEILANQAAIAIQNANLYASIDRALDQRVAELATLQEIDRQINLELDFGRVMDRTLEWAMRVTGAIAGTLSLVSEDRQTLQIVAHRGYPPELEAYFHTSWPAQEGIMGQVVRSGEPVVIDDVSKDASYVDAAAGAGSHLAVPLRREEQIIGVLSLEGEANTFSADHVAFLLRLADHATVAIENARLYEQTKQRVAELGALRQISLDLTSQLNLTAVLESIAAHTRTLVQADCVYIYLYDPHKDVLSFGTRLSERGKTGPLSLRADRNPLAARVARQGDPVIVHDARQQAPFLPADWSSGAMALIPLRKAGRVLGVFDISFNDPRPFTEDDLRVLNLLADQAAIAIDNAQLFASVQHASEARTEFSDMVSRELRAPLTAIQGYIKLLVTSAADALTQEHNSSIDVILRNVQRISDLANDLADFSRVGSGRVRLSPRPVDLARMARDAVENLRKEWTEREHTLTVSIPDDLPRAQVDPIYVFRVWIHLLDNACRYTPRGGQIKIWAQRRMGLEAFPDQEQWILCAIQDSGIGIAPEERERIFEAFYRVEESRVRQEPGSGLGLAIARGIIELHGGRIWAESSPGQGSTLYFTLPGMPESPH